MLPRPAKPISLLLPLLVSLLLPALAVAQDGDDESGDIDSADEQPAYDPAERAAEYYEEAARAYSDGNFERAAELLGRAYAHEPNLIYKYNEILAHLGMGDYEQALRMLDTFEEPMRADGRFDDLDEIRDELEEAVAASEDDDTAVDVAQPDELEPDDGAPREGPNLLAWSLVGGGGALFTGGLVVASGLLIGDTIDRLEGATTPEGYQEIYGDGTYDYDQDSGTLRTHQIVATVLLSAGIVTAATGGTLLWLDSSDSDSSQAYRLQIEPVLDGQLTGLTIRGRF